MSKRKAFGQIHTISIVDITSAFAKTTDVE